MFAKASLLLGPLFLFSSIGLNGSLLQLLGSQLRWFSVDQDALDDSFALIRLKMSSVASCGSARSAFSLSQFRILIKRRLFFFIASNHVSSCSTRKGDFLNTARICGANLDPGCDSGQPALQKYPFRAKTLPHADGRLTTKHSPQLVEVQIQLSTI